MTMILLSSVLFVCLAVSLILALLLNRFSLPSNKTPPIAPGDVNLALRYGPMQRLLDKADYKFLAGQSALGKSAAWKMRAQRRVVFRSYLRCLGKDYACVCACIRRIMMQSGMDRPELARALLRNRMIFNAALVGIEVRLAMHACGWGTVDVGPLVASLEGMRQQLDSLLNAGIGLQPAMQSAIQPS